MKKQEEKEQDMMRELAEFAYEFSEKYDALLDIKIKQRKQNKKNRKERKG